MGNCLAPPSLSPSSSIEASANANTRSRPSATGQRERRRSGTRSRSSRSRPFSHARTDSGVSMGPTLDALRNYATLPHPRSSLPASKLLLSTENAIAVFDAYPKAKYHFLVIPRYPFPPQSDPESRQSIVPLDALDDLKSLLMKASGEAREEVLTAMSNMAREVEEMVRDEMLKTEGFEWKIDIGFHAIPSMKHVHLHVISDDRISPALKTKKHHNSFRPDLGFFIPIMEVQRWIEDDSNMQERVDALSGAERLLNTPVTCHKCDEFQSNIPKLKTHLEKHFQDERSAALRYIAKHGRQRSDEDVF